MTDLEDRLHADLPRLAELISQGSDESLASLEAPRARSRNRGRAIAAAVAVCIAVGGLAVAVGHSSDDAHTPSASPRVVVRGRWRALPPSPLGPRANAVAVWTGHDVLVWGGFRGPDAAPLALQNGAAYNPATRSWRPIASNSWAHPGAHGVWADDRLFILAKNGGAVYNPATDKWHDLALLPDQSGGGFLAAASSGKSLFGVVAQGTGHLIAVARYNAAGDSWTVGRSLRVAWRSDLHNASTVWIDNELVVTDGSGKVWAYNPTADTWRVIPGLPHNTTASTITSIGGALVVVSNENGTLHAAKLVGHRWQTVANAPHTRIVEPIAVDAGGVLVVIDRSDSSAPVLADSSTHKWVSLDGYPLRRGVDGTAVWTGTGLFVWGGLPPGTPATFPNPTPGTPDAAWYER